MSFGDTFWKVWEVRTSIKIQESIENLFNRPSNFDNNEEIINALVKTQISWNQKISQSRQGIQQKVRTLECEHCSNRFNIYTQAGAVNKFSGVAYFDKTACRVDENVILQITKQLEKDNSFNPLFYCSKKCILEDRTIVILEFK
jgi:hypothetical protein